MVAPNKSTIAGGAVSILAAGALQFFTITLPEMQRVEHETRRADANKDRNFEASDALRVSNHPVRFQYLVLVGKLPGDATHDSEGLKRLV